MAEAFDLTYYFERACRNLVLAISLFVIRTRAELAQTRDFLDHV